MIQPDKLSLAEVERRIAVADSGGMQEYNMDLYRQLLETMKALKTCVEYLEWEADQKKKVSSAHFFKHAAALLPAQESLEQRNKDSDHVG